MSSIKPNTKSEIIVRYKEIRTSYVKYFS